MRGLLPCPNPKCPHPKTIESLYCVPSTAMSEYHRSHISCRCGASGPWAETMEAAIAAWNALPRAPKWITYDGTSKTLPGDPRHKLLVSAVMHGGPRVRMLAWATSNGWNDARNSVWPYTPGDRWMPWPGENPNE